MLQLREQLGQDEKGNVSVAPVGGMGGDSRDVGVTSLLHHIIHPATKSVLFFLNDANVTKHTHCKGIPNNMFSAVYFAYSVGIVLQPQERVL
jgi:hypothetical protein